MFDIMLDIETLGTKPGSVISQIGGVQFNVEKGTLGRAMLINVDIDDCIKQGMTVDGSTICWWMKQSDAARAHFNQMPLLSLRLALQKLGTLWYPVEGDTRKDPCPWGHGATFDIVLLEAAYRAVGERVPWTYRSARCLRTIALTFEIKEPPMRTLEEYKALGMHQNPFAFGGCSDWGEPTVHNALYDAARQAEWALTILSDAYKINVSKLGLNVSNKE